jgi:dTDP-4-amino-4,6-dideoxygalactose transaminase
MDVPFFRLELQEDEINSVVSVLRSGWLTTGPQVALFEQEFADFIGGGVQAVAVSSNTAGMHLALEALGLAPGDEVIVPTLTFTATAEAVHHVGAEVVFVDVDERSLCIDPDKIAAAITPRTRALRGSTSWRSRWTSQSLMMRRTPCQPRSMGFTWGQIRLRQRSSVSMQTKR